MRSRHAKVIVMGGGTGGIAVASRLARELPHGSILLFEPSDTHYYQPLFTLVGGGVADLAATRRPTAKLVPEGVEWVQQCIESFAPQRNEVTSNGEAYSYDFLVVAAGIQIDWAKIPGLSEALEGGVVCSNYSERFVDGTWKQIQAFKGGTAIFTQPATPIKCGGAPQKIMYLAEERFRKAGVRKTSKVIFATATEKIFSVAKYADALTKIVNERDIEVLFRTNLIAIDAENRTAEFERLPAGGRFSIPFDLMHVTPPMSAPSVLATSELASPSGWVDVDKHTLQHVRFLNVFSLGDSSSLPTSKTGAAIRKQAPVLVKNLLAAMNSAPLPERYDGYTSCPLVTGIGKVILAEFDYDLKPQETFPFDQSKERLSMYLLKKHGLPALYWHGMMRGRL